MFSLTDQHRYFLYKKSVDMRKGFRGLSGLVRNELNRDVLSGEVFIFINRRRNRMKILVWQTGGFLTYYKALEAGVFERPEMVGDSQSAQISLQELQFIVAGVELRSVRKLKRFSLKKTG